MKEITKSDNINFYRKKIFLQVISNIYNSKILSLRYNSNYNYAQLFT